MSKQILIPVALDVLLAVAGWEPQARPPDVGLLTYSLVLAGSIVPRG